jgi:TRAP-type uncharacterized transport system substrate-binding protein
MNLKHILTGAAFMLAHCFGTTSTMAEEAVNVCSGSKGLRYSEFVASVAQRAQGLGVTVNEITTKGSGDNVSRYQKGECDAMPMQPEFAEDVGLEPTFELWDEFAHLVCRKNLIPSGADEIGELVSSGKVIPVGGAPKGSGNRRTWDTWAEENGDYGPGHFALMELTVNQSIELMIKGGVPCTFFVSGLKPDYMKLLDQPGASNTLVLIELDDGDLDDRWEYDHISLDDAVYPNIMGSNTTTVAVNSGFYIRPSLSESNPMAYTVLISMGQTVAEEMRAKMVND